MIMAYNSQDFKFLSSVNMPPSFHTPLFLILVFVSWSGVNVRHL